MGSRQDGTNPRALGTNPKALGQNPKALGTNPRALGTNPKARGDGYLSRGMRKGLELARRIAPAPMSNETAVAYYQRLTLILDEALSRNT